MRHRTLAGLTLAAAFALLASCDESSAPAGVIGGGGGGGTGGSTLRIDTTTLPAADVGVLYSAQLQASGGSGGYSWHLGYMPQPFTVTVGTGSFATFEGTPMYAGVFVFEAYVRDSAGDVAHASMNLQVGPGAQVNPVMVTTSALPDAIVGVAYNFQLAASGGVGAYNWSNIYAVDGLGITPSGQIYGTPTTPGDRVWMVCAVDATPTMGLSQFRIRVRPFGGALRLTAHPGYPGYDSGPAVICLVNEFEIKHFRALGGTGQGHQWSITAGTLPPGMSTVTVGGDCFLAGLCNVQGTWNVTLRVRDSAGASHSWAISLVVSAPDPPPEPLGR